MGAPLEFCSKRSVVAVLASGVVISLTALTGGIAAEDSVGERIDLYKRKRWHVHSSQNNPRHQGTKIRRFLILSLGVLVSWW